MEITMNRPIAFTTAVFGILIALGSAALAQNFPDRPVHLVVPYGPGGITDFAGRTVAQALGKVLGQTVVVDNKPGAGGIVGVDYVAHSAPDGYQMAVMDPAVVINPILQKSMPYDIFKDFTSFVLRSIILVNGLVDTSLHAISIFICTASIVIRSSFQQC